jgi:hypothetical protein
MYDLRNSAQGFGFGAATGTFGFINAVQNGGTAADLGLVLLDVAALLM